MESIPAQLETFPRRPMPKGKPHNIMKRYGLEDTCTILKLPEALDTQGGNFAKISIRHSMCQEVKDSIAENLCPEGGNVIVAQTVAAVQVLAKHLNAPYVTGATTSQLRDEVGTQLSSGTALAVVTTVDMLEHLMSHRNYTFTHMHWTCLCGIRPYTAFTMMHNKAKVVFYTHAIPHNFELAMLRRSIETLGLAQQTSQFRAQQEIPNE